MNLVEALKHFESTNLVDLGMQADAVRRQLHPERIVTYATDDEDTAVRVIFRTPEQLIEELNRIGDVIAITPVCAASGTAAEYLKVIAFCRLYLTVPHVQLAPDWSGLKVAQLALRFGADDFGSKKPSPQMSEEEIRRTIRDAGFVPKKRDAMYRSLSLY